MSHYDLNLDIQAPSIGMVFKLKNAKEIIFFLKIIIVLIEQLPYVYLLKSL